MFALCDQRAFYCSAEAVFRPDLRDKPVVVLSNNDGCVVALNEQAKEKGVKKFEPYFKQRDLIRATGTVVFSSNYELYGEISSRIMDTLQQLSPSEIEVYSIDEAFIDLRMLPLESVKAFAEQARDRVWVEQRIKMGVSIGATKTLAKLGQYATKKIPSLNRICVIERDDQRRWLLERVPVEEVWGIGRRLTAKLRALGVHTAADLSVFGVDDAQRLQGITLVRTIRELNGEIAIEMEDSPPPKQQIICSRSFGKPLTQSQDVFEALANFAVRVSEKLRSQDSSASRVSAWVVMGGHDSRISLGNSVELRGFTNDARQLSRAAQQIVSPLLKSNFGVRKAGVSVTDIRPNNSFQDDLFEPKLLKTPQTMIIMDAINKKFGRGTLKLGRQLGQQEFEMRRQFLSPRILSNWYEIPKINC